MITAVYLKPMNEQSLNQSGLYRELYSRFVWKARCTDNLWEAFIQTPQASKHE